MASDLYLENSFVRRHSTIKNEHISSYIGTLANRLRREIDALSLCGEYSGAEGKILHFILAHTDSEIFQKDLEEEFGMRPSSASALIKKMEQNGLITREPVSYDGRFKRIVPSEKALQNKVNVLHGVQALESRLLDGISKEQQEQWLAITKKMIQNL